MTEAEWRADYEAEKQQIMQALHIHDSVTILACLFKRLLTLQQQLLQGGATYNSATTVNNSAMPILYCVR